MPTENFIEKNLQKLRDRLTNQRHKILNYPALHRVFFEKHGYPLNLNNPKTFSELINHKKIFDRDPLIPITSDKYRVREYVRQKLGNELAEKILIPVYHVSKTGLDIPFEDWDFEFFMKANHHSGGNLLVKPGTDPQTLRETCRTWLSSSFGQNLHEWGYRDILRRIICEKVLRDDQGEILNDYKFYCFNGEVVMITVIKDRFSQKKIKFTLDPDFNLLDGPYPGNDFPEKVPEIPNFKQMIRISRSLSADFSHARIDFYSFADQVFFGEITQYTGSGLVKMSSYEFDLQLGAKWLKKK